MKSRSQLSILALSAALVLALIAGCGGGDSGSGSGNEDPQQLLTETFNSNAPLNSGVLDVSLDATAAGAKGGSLKASLTGPFQSGGDGALPQLGLTASAAGGTQDQPIDFKGGLTLTADGAYVSYNGADYKVDDPTYQTFAQTYAQSAQAQADQQGSSSQVFDQLGIDPSTWLTDVTNQGTEDLNGAQVIHISGTPDVAKIIEDTQSLTQATGSASQLNPADLSKLEGSISDAQLNIYTGADDKVFRKLDLSLKVDDPTNSGAGTLDLNFSLAISDVNQDQTIAAPANAQPIEDLIPGGLGALAGGGALGSGTATPATPAQPPAGSSGSGAAPNDAYLKCINKAGSTKEITACADKL